MVNTVLHSLSQGHAFLKMTLRFANHVTKRNADSGNENERVTVNVFFTLTEHSFTGWSADALQLTCSYHIRGSVGRQRTGITEVMGSNPVVALKFFQAKQMHLLKLLAHREDHH